MEGLPRFEELREKAYRRKGREEVEGRMPEVKSEEELRATGDDRYLAAMARAAFSAGFKHYIVDAMWEGFEEAFVGFEPGEVAEFGHEKIVELGEDERIVRNKTKIWATVENAAFVREVSAECGGFGAYVADWGAGETVELWEALGERGTHLGGNTGPRALRHAGRDTFILTRDVTWVLREKFGVMSYSRKSKTGRREAQEAMLEWSESSGRPMADVSMILACAFETPEEYAPVR